MISFDFYNTDSEFAFSLTLDSDSRGLQFVELSPNQTIGTVVNVSVVRDSEFIIQHIASEYDSDYFNEFVETALTQTLVNNSIPDSRIQAAVDSELPNILFVEPDASNPDPVIGDFTNGIIFIGQY